MKNTASEIKKALEKIKNPIKAAQKARFFQTESGGYGQGDKFLGITVPEQRKIAASYKHQVKISDIEQLFESAYHEHRFTGVLLLVSLYEQNKSEAKRQSIVDFYLSQTHALNNWDLVDASAYKILGHFLHDKDKNILYKLAESENLWEQRIAMVACMFDIKKGVYETALSIANLLLHHQHDLIQKAVGWMLKEISKNSIHVTDQFLVAHYKNMPRTSLRYAIEKFPEARRKALLHGNI
jgi:3-methyladenine DNA glycosylase AlkD